MTERTIQDDPAAVLRALADGYKVRHHSWTGMTVRLKEGSIQCDNGLVHVLPLLTGTWHVLPKRDMATDPRVGDRAKWRDSGKVVVVEAATERGVYCYFEAGGPYAHSLRDWAKYVADGDLIPLEYANA